MKNLCTLSDKNFLAKGLALYKSIQKTSSEEFVLHYLCMDEESFNTLTSLNLPGLVPESLQAMEERIPELQAAKNNRPYNEYCWTLASYYMDYRMAVEADIADSITYIDSDIYFYADPKIFFDEIGEKSVGIIAHRHNAVGDRDGAYNVGVVYFKNDQVGRECLHWWSQAVLNRNHPELMTCGDQKYLESFIPMFGKDNVCVVDKTYAHGAPWNYRLYCWDELEQTGYIRWGDKAQKFLFNHFSRFGYDITKDEIAFTTPPGKYADHTLNGQVFSIPQVYNLYVNYYKELKAIHLDMLTPKAPAVLQGFPKLSVGMIVFEGDYVLKQCLESLYDHVHQIMVAEGPVAYWQGKGRTTSTDKTNAILDNFPDPKGKIKVVHGQFAEKDDQCKAYMQFLDPNADYIWNVDSDEVYKPEDIEKLLRLLQDNKYTSVGVRSCSFFGGFERYITGWEQKKDQFLRVFKVYPGSTWLTHRPPTIRHSTSDVWPDNHLDSDSLFDKTGIQMYHMSYVYPRQVYNKVGYYKEALTKHKCLDDYFAKVYMPWILGDATDRARIEGLYQGVHEWVASYREPTFTAEFTGDHPTSIQRSMPELVSEFNLQKHIYAGL